jgi:hypothetical protein
MSTFLNRPSRRKAAVSDRRTGFLSADQLFVEVRFA